MFQQQPRKREDDRETHAVDEVAREEEEYKMDNEI
jgi:hypothetical protein